MGSAQGNAPSEVPALPVDALGSETATHWAASGETRVATMKVYRVVTERDGATTTEPGRTSVELVREEFRYAANTIQRVWDAIEWIRNDPERTLLAVVEEAPSIDVLHDAERLT